MMRRWHLLSVTCLIVIAGLHTHAQAASTSIVISQIYTGQLGQYDFVELFNRGNTAVTLDGWTLQVSTTDDDLVWDKFNLSGTVAPGQYYLLRTLSRGGRGVSPPPDADRSSVRIDAGGGQMAVVRSDLSLREKCNLASTDAVDSVSWGTSRCANHTDAWDTTTALMRLQGGCADRDNSDDFTIASPTPRTSKSIRNPCGILPEVGTRSFNILEAGGYSAVTAGSDPGITGGFARIDRANLDAVNPSGLAIFSLRQEGTLISEASVPATPAIRAGMFYALVSGSINTGLAIANLNNEDVNISYRFIDSSTGTSTQSGILSIPANTQVARFLNELPFALTTPAQGTFSFSATLPVGVIALRGNTNQRGEFLVTTLPVVDSSAPTSNTAAYLAHFAVNGGWRTELIMTCRGPGPCAGTVDFRDQAGNAVTVNVDSLVANSFPYVLPQEASERFIVSGVGAQPVSGSIRISPADGTATPVSTAVFSFVRNNVTVSEAGLTSPRGKSFRTYVEYSGALTAIGSIQPGLAIANTESSSATVDLQLFRLDGTSAGSPVTITLPANGQVAKFVNELFPSLAAPFQGILKVSSVSSISVIGLRGRYNERRDFLITTVPATDETTVVSGSMLFPHIVDSGGYTTQFIMFGNAGQASSGQLRLFTTGGQPLGLLFR